MHESISTCKAQSKQNTYKAHSTGRLPAFKCIRARLRIFASTPRDLGATDQETDKAVFQYSGLTTSAGLVFVRLAFFSAFLVPPLAVLRRPATDPNIPP